MKAVRLAACLALCVLATAVMGDAVRYNSTSGTFSLGNGTLPVAAEVSVNLTYTTTGWDVLVARGDSAFMAESAEQRLLGYRAAGFGEGYLMRERIYQSYYNTFNTSGEPALTPCVSNWIDAHIAYLRARSNQTDAFGQTLAGLLAQLDGISEGFNAAPHATTKMTFRAIFLLNFQAEIGDIDVACQASEKSDGPRPARSRHCSGLVKVMPDDVYFSHVTWTSFNSMLRTYKTYQFDGRLVTMSSYPGLVHSIDDWYMTSGQLAVMETTNGVDNTTLFTQYVRNGQNTTSEFLRVMIANYLADSGESWVKKFSMENSGTYNNQWMVFDMKLYKPGMKELAPGSLWVAEQLPNSVTSGDETAVLNTKSYWASYNIPYFPSVYNESGNEENYEKYGNFFSYTKYSRAMIFARNHSDVKDLESMKALMRYNNFKHDKLSLIQNCSAAKGGKCDPAYSAMLAIASRGDLNPPGGESMYGVNWQYLTRRNHCGTDVKIATWKNMMRTAGKGMIGIVINGPTAYGQPVFKWSTSPWANDMSIPRLGLVDSYDFPFMEYEYGLVTPAAEPAADADGKKAEAIIGGIIGGGIVLMVLGAIVYRTTSASDEQSYDSLNERAE